MKERLKNFRHLHGKSRGLYWMLTRETQRESLKHALNYGKMWPIKEKENRRLHIWWPNLIPYSKLWECVVTVLLLTSTLLRKGTTEKRAVVPNLQIETTHGTTA